MNKRADFNVNYYTNLMEMTETRDVFALLMESFVLSIL